MCKPWKTTAINVWTNCSPELSYQYTGLREKLNLVNFDGKAGSLYLNVTFQKMWTVIPLIFGEGM